MTNDEKLMQQALDALELAKNMSEEGFVLSSTGVLAEPIEALRARLAQPEPEQEQSYKDKPCIEDDGCPTEKAVLQRFWRKHQQPEPEPVAWLFVNKFDGGEYILKHSEEGISNKDEFYVKPLYTAPAQRDDTPAKAVEWQGLTDSERNKIFDCYGYGPIDVVAMCRAIEAKLREKNT